MTDNTTDPSPDNYIASAGARCPIFVADNVFAAVDDKNIHSVTFPDPDPYARGDGRITIRAIINPSGALVTYNNSVNIYRRMFMCPDTAVQVFRATVAITASESEGPRPQYDPAFDPVKFDDVDVEVED